MTPFGNHECCPEDVHLCELHEIRQRPWTGNAALSPEASSSPVHDEILHFKLKGSRLNRAAPGLKRIEWQRSAS